MPKLENYIKNHLAEFDSNEPEPGHFVRFEHRLDVKPEKKLSGNYRLRFLKVAALIILLISLSVFVFDFGTREIRERFADEKQGTELPLEIREAVQYYDNQANTQIATIHKLAANQEDAASLSASALNEVQSLDATTSELKKSLAENPGNEHIFDAIIRNQQMKEAMLKTIITQLSQFKK